MIREEAVIVFDGNCSPADAGGETLNSQVAGRLTIRAQLFDATVATRSISECLIRFDETVTSLRNYNAPLSVLVYNAGSHDLVDDTSVDEAYQALHDYVALAHEHGWKVIVTANFESPALSEAIQQYRERLAGNKANADVTIVPNLPVSMPPGATQVHSVTIADLTATAIDDLWASRPAREKLVLFGEVQILAIYRHLLTVLQEARSDRFEVEFVDSNDDRALEAATALLADSGTLILQINPERPFLHEKLTAALKDAKVNRTFSVPMLLCRSLWPFDQFDDHVETATTSPVKGTRGDALLAELVKQSTGLEPAVSEYLSIDLNQKRDLTQLFQADLQSWKSLESLSDVKFAHHFEEHFALKKLFNSFKLPSNLSIKILVDAICKFLDFKATEIAISNKKLVGAEILQPDTPIHPSIARHFNLHWLKKRPLFDIFGRKFDYPRWATEYAKIHAPKDILLATSDMPAPGSNFEPSTQITTSPPRSAERTLHTPALGAGPSSRESQAPSPRPKWWSIRQATQSNKLFLLCVALPVFLSTVYYTLFAADVYVSQSSFLVRSPQKANQPAGLFTALLGSGVSRSSDDTYAVNDYMTSRDALASLNHDDAFEKAYGSGRGDFISRFGVLPTQRSFEDLLRYFRRRALVQYDTDTGITTLEVHAFSADDASKINERLLELGEQRVNRMNDRAKQDLISYAQREVEHAEAALQKSSVALSAFRDKQAIFDPERQSTLALQNVLQIQKDLVASKLQLAQLKSVSPNNPQIPALDVRINTLQSEMDKAAGTITGGRNSLAYKSPAYERLELDRQFADRQLTAALASLETARNDAQRQQLYLERISQPNVPDKAILPYRFRNILATLILGLVVWGTLNLLIASIREHRD
ncbi:WcbI family polysaccharide biosynthesis putative acetyltransferase [Burkholderia cepacia]|uniref:WcbI family polysaccharide biosynthesis putative acetyltransferase n=1 Tax=Burkholderia cepacia TaxID=292 RepID=UPI001EEF767B|nr:WcbI family polysaccharide biosynthesis putative acetyltransferase [Burkholderia cepacia]MCE4126280.1 hypothetical protein [Burkholderia cepacia]